MTVHATVVLIGPARVRDFRSDPKGGPNAATLTEYPSRAAFDADEGGRCIAVVQTMDEARKVVKVLRPAAQVEEAP
jgi:hypothetical protein